MVTPIVNKAGAKAMVAAQELGQKTVQKPGLSKFDQVRVNLQNYQPSLPQKLPPEVTQISAEQKKILESDLRKRLENSCSRNPKELFKVDMKKAQSGLESLRRQVSAVPNSPGFDSIRLRLANIESQYRQSGKLLSSLGGMDSPRDFLKLQMEMYKMTQNVEILGKVVEQVNTGIKSVLNTPV